MTLGSNGRVLIIEDDWTIAQDIGGTLADAGYDVVGMAGSLRKAIKAIDETGFDVAILDANLGGYSSEPVAAALRGREIPFVVVSGYASEQRSGALSDAPFLAKPYSSAELVAKVRSLRRAGSAVGCA